MSAARLLIGTRKGLISYERGSHGWSTTGCAHAGIPVVYAVSDPRDGSIWASLDHGHWGQKVSRSRDGGQGWEEIPSPSYPADAELVDGKPATLRYVWVIAPGPADRPGRIYLGTQPGGLFQSDDPGEGFTLVEGLWEHPSRREHWFGGGFDTPGIHSVVVDPRDSRRLLVAVSCAGVFESLDEGASWAPLNRGLRADFLPDPDSEVGQDPHSLMLCLERPDVLWQQNHCGIFRTEDGGQEWTEVSEPEGGTARFGFAIAAHPTEPGTAWVVPAISDQQRMALDGALCVCRTEDGGRSWTALREGLPQRDVYDVVYRHALDLREETLAFGSTTGNLYVSDDRGERWECLGHHLPPIYSVRFA